MKKILFIQHSESDQPGLLGEIMARAGLSFKICHPYAGESLPQSLEEFAGVALGGGSQSVCELEKYSYLKAEAELVKSASDLGKPVLGLCLGAQIMALALGGNVHRAGKREIGFFPVTFSPASRSDPLLHGLPNSMTPIHWHEDVIELPASGTTLLGSSELTPTQIFRCGSGMYGLQFHLEMTLELLEEWLADSGKYLMDLGIHPSRLRLEAQRFLPALRPTADIIFSRWISTLKT